MISTSLPDNSEGRGGRILHVASTYPRWEGDATAPFVHHLAKDLQDLGWPIDVLAPHAPGAAARETLDGIAVERFRYLWPAALQTLCYDGGGLAKLKAAPANALKLPAFVVAEWLALFSRLASGRYDLLHAHWVLPQGFIGALAAAPLRVPLLVTVHGGDVFALNQGVFNACKRFALNRADAVTVNSSMTAAAVNGLTPRARGVHRVPMGVAERRSDAPAVADLRRRYRRHDGPLLLFVGRLVPEKGGDDVISAMASMRERAPWATALIVGEGPDKDRLQRLSETNGLSDRITFTGWVSPDRIADYFAAADVFVGPSKRSSQGWVEAQGLTFAEAMLAGTPVVATRSGGIPDLVRHEETGLLVSESAPEEIAAAIERLVGESGLAERLARAGRKIVLERYTRSASAAAFSDLYREMLARRRGQKGSAPAMSA